MTEECQVCDDDVDDEKPITEVADEGRVCGPECALELLAEAQRLVACGGHCPSCGDPLTPDARVPDGYARDHCSTCAIQIERRQIQTEGRA